MILYHPRTLFCRLWPRFARAFSNTGAALLLVSALKLESPCRAAMSALIVIQPTRGLLFEKSVCRFVGTAIGAMPVAARNRVLPVLKDVSIALQRMVIPGLEQDGSPLRTAAAFFHHDNWLGENGRSKPCPS